MSYAMTHYRRCDKCRWYAVGKCRFFDTDQNRAADTKTACTCPFYELRGRYIQDDEILTALHMIAAEIQLLRAFFEESAKREITMFCMPEDPSVPSMGHDAEKPGDKAGNRLHLYPVGGVDNFGKDN